jgi:Helitron helicase-like domain at N-terminus
MLTKSLVILYSLYSLYLLELCPYYLHAHILPHTCAVVDHIQDSYIASLTHSYNTSNPDVSASIASSKSISASQRSDIWGHPVSANPSETISDSLRGGMRANRSDIDAMLLEHVSALQRDKIWGINSPAPFVGVMLLAPVSASQRSEIWGINSPAPFVGVILLEPISASKRSEIFGINSPAPFVGVEPVSTLHQSKFEGMNYPACQSSVISFGQFSSSQRSKTIFKWLSVMCLSSPESVQFAVRKIRLGLERSHHLRHDFFVLLCFLVNLFRPLYKLPDSFMFRLGHILHLNLRGWYNSHNHPGDKVLSANWINGSTTDVIIGGGRNLALSFTLEELLPHVVSERTSYTSSSVGLDFIEHVSQYISSVRHEDDFSTIICKMPLSQLVCKMTIKDIKNVARVHRVHIPSKLRLPDIHALFDDHFCPCCESHVSVFKPHLIKTDGERFRKWYNGIDQDKKATRVKANALKKTRNSQMEKEKCVENALKKTINNQVEKENIVENNATTADNDLDRQQNTEVHTFPPEPPTDRIKHRIIADWCKDISPDAFEEAGCAVCGQLTLLKELVPLSDADCNYELLLREGSGMTRLERNVYSDPVQEIKGPVIDHECSSVCRSCRQILHRGHVPTYALANGLWLGKTPPVLQDLKFAERMLISRVRHNHCVVRVSSGMTKMTANAVTFENPMPKIYQALPPPLEELDQVLAFIYTGPCKPTLEDLKRTPLLVRRNRVAMALEWLKLNHKDYYDLEISYENLMQYPEEGSPVVVTYKSAFENKLPEATSLHDNEEEDGVEDGDCPFVVHGLTGEQLGSMKDMKTLVARALKHLNEDGGKVLAIGHETEPQSIFHNPKLYPQMFPWLFPYGLGGIGSTSKQMTRMGEAMHKRRLLMYHDKRFQKDSFFPHIAFNHEQIKGSSTGGYLLADKQSFPDIANRLLNIDTVVMANLSKRMMDGERVKPQTDAEKACFQLIHDLDHIAGKVDGSTTTKKYMRNEIWSLISYRGAPSWFITFAPADVKHPLCLYFADNKETFSPELRCPKEARRLIANNPVAGARFFHTMVQLFIKHVLGVGTNHRGIYGDTSAYYGTVEQQGRLTLHLHSLLWIVGSLTPQEIRDRIMDKNSDF